MRKPTFDEQEYEFLKEIYDLAGGIANKKVNMNKITSASSEQVINIMVELTNKGLANFPFQYAEITRYGIKEVDKQMTQDYAETELLVLKTIYELSKNNPRNEVSTSDLAKAIGTLPYSLVGILTELEDRKRFLGDASDDHQKLTPAGIEFLQGKSNMKDNRNIHNVTNINAPVGNLQQFTHNSSQSFTQIHAPSSVPDDLVGQISLLREELKKMARAQEDAGHDTSDYDEAIGAVTSARKALTEGDESKAKSCLLTSGKFVADFASKIGVNLITELIKQQSGL